jgi:hypothetical protein
VQVGIPHPIKLIKKLVEVLRGDAETGLAHGDFEAGTGVGWLF